MSFEEKSTWVGSVVTLLAVVGYSSFILLQSGKVKITEIDYQWPMIISIGAVIVMSVIGNILMSIYTAVSAKMEGLDSENDIDRRDERDEYINRRGELVGYYASSVGLLLVLALAMLEYDHFWIANALYLTLVIGGLVSSAAKLLAYRRGF